MLLIDCYAYTNRLVSVHPAEKGAFALATMIICLMSPSITVYALIAALVAVAVVKRAGIPLSVYLKALAVPAAFLLASVGVVAVSISGSAEGYIAGFAMGGYFIGVHPGDLDIALRLFLRSIGAISCLFFLSMTTPLVEIINMLRKLKLPSVIIDIMVLMYRFIFVLMETAVAIFNSQSSRLGYCSLKNSYKSMGSLAVNLLFMAYRRSEAIYTAMASRGYEGEIRVLEHHHRLSGVNAAAIAAIDIILILISLAEWSGGGPFGGIHF
ncbi:MAG: cobalt ECF transporter T component CbiQ [Bacillota bacterium]